MPCADGDLGAYQEGTSATTDSECRELCEGDRMCAAYEFSTAHVHSQRKCELHYAPVTHTFQGGRGAGKKCYLKPGYVFPPLAPPPRAPPSPSRSPPLPWPVAVGRR